MGFLLDKTGDFEMQDLLFGNGGFAIGFVIARERRRRVFIFGRGNGGFGDEAAKLGEPFDGLEFVVDGDVWSASLYVINKEVDEYFAVVGGLPYVSFDVHIGYYNKQNECVKG